MDLFEYQGKELLRKFEVPVPEGRVASTPEEAASAAHGLGGKVIVKAQVQVGGRGKAGGIKLAGSPDEARAVAEQILGMDIKGHIVKRVLVERAGDIKAEYYCSFLLDRSERNFLGMMSAKGGMDIEEVAVTDPDAIARVHIDPLLGMSEFHARRARVRRRARSRGPPRGDRLLPEAVRRLRGARRLIDRGQSSCPDR